MIVSLKWPSTHEFFCLYWRWWFNDKDWPIVLSFDFLTCLKNSFLFLIYSFFPSPCRFEAHRSSLAKIAPLRCAVFATIKCFVPASFSIPLSSVALPMCASSVDSVGVRAAIDEAGAAWKNKEHSKILKPPSVSFALARFLRSCCKQTG